MALNELKGRHVTTRSVVDGSLEAIFDNVSSGVATVRPGCMTGRCTSLSYLVIVKLAVLEVGGGGDAAHAGVGVVEGVLAHAVGETLLEKTFRGQERSRMMSRHLGDTVVLGECSAI